MNEWLIAFETVVLAIGVIIVALSWMQHRESLAKLQVEAWRETLGLPPTSIFMRPGVQPVPVLVGKRESEHMKVKLAKDIEGIEDIEDHEPRPGVH